MGQTEQTPAIVGGSSWYECNHRSDESIEFFDWFENFYGTGSEYINDKNELEEYWIRRAFALMGWNAAKKEK